MNLNKDSGFNFSTIWEIEVSISSPKSQYSLSVTNCTVSCFLTGCKTLGAWYCGE